jgi:hypothetical protein
MGFTGSLTIKIEDAGFGCPGAEGCGGGSYPPDRVPITVVIPGSGAAAVNGLGARGHLTALGFAGGGFAIDLVVPVTDPSAFPLAGLQVTAANGVGDFSGGGGDAFGGVMPMNGVMKLCLLSTACSGNAANLTIPLSVVGHDGTAFVEDENLGVNLTVVGAPWTTGTAAIGTMTVMGGVSPLSNTGAPGGNVNLVTPVFISTNINVRRVWGPVFGILGLDFTPEPEALLIGGTAIVSLVALGFVRSRSAN